MLDVGADKLVRSYETDATGFRKRAKSIVGLACLLKAGS